LQLTIVLLALLMALVLLCTLAQVELGTFGAVSVYMRSLIVWWRPHSLPFPVPVFPGGALVGLILTANLTAALIKRFKFTWNKVGLWVVHGGLIVLVAGEFATGAFQVDTRMSIEEGQSSNFLENLREMELAVTDVTDAGADKVYGIPESLLAKSPSIPVPGTPLTIHVKKFFKNAELGPRGPMDPPSLATAGVGSGVRITELPAASSDNEMNRTSAFIEPFAGGRSYGVWLVSFTLGAPQSITHEGRTYMFAIRPKRDYLPYTLTLKKFSHDRYPGTDIPKNFSSLVRLTNPSKGENRDVLIFMNQPLRYDGKAFYQASFGKEDKLSILQVVENPGWLLPYVSCVLVTLGLLIHFGITLRRSLKRRQEQEG
jgi:hypothetical protein